MRKFRGLPVLKYARYVSKSVALPWTSKKISKLIYHIWHPLYLHPVILKNSRARYPSVQFSKGKKCQISQSAAFLISRHSFRFLSDSWYIPTLDTSFFDVVISLVGSRPLNHWIKTLLRNLWTYFWSCYWKWNLIQLFVFASFILSFEQDVRQ